MRWATDPAVLMVRPRGWHLDERHVTVDGAPWPAAWSISASISSTMRALRSMPAPAPISICPSSRAAARRPCGATSSPSPRAELGLARGTIKATVLIETITAAFEMDEILHALRENIVGLNCGRWDYIFSTIKRLGRSAGPPDSRSRRDDDG